MKERNKEKIQREVAVMKKTNEEECCTVNKKTKECII